VLFELEVQVSVGESALGPVFFDDHVAVTGGEVGVEFAAPGAFGESVALLDADLGGVGVGPVVVVTGLPATCGTMNTRIPAARAAAVIARRLSSSPTSVATCSNRGQICPPSDKKSEDDVRHPEHSGFIVIIQNVNRRASAPAIRRGRQPTLRVKCR
jgi:hypothetical protein